MCGYPPFEVFFGRKENSNIESLDITKSQDAPTESDDNDLKQWQENIFKIREESTMAQVKASTSMVERHRNKHPPSEYSLHDEVVYKKLLSSKKIIKRGKGLITGTGRVVKRKNNMYKISFQRKEGKSQTDWFPVSMLTSTTRNEEILRKKKAKGKANNFESKTLGAQDQAQKQQEEQTSDKNVDFEMSSEVVDSVDHAIMKIAHEVFNKNIPELKCYPKRN